jgi:DNA mismatch endonuclease (patch repair protein)
MVLCGTCDRLRGSNSGESKLADIVTPEVRSKMMSGIRGRDTKPEMTVRRYLHRCGFRYRLHDRSLPGVPDLVFPRFRVVVMVHGCFWHQHSGCQYATTPKNNWEFWQTKLVGNVARDKRNIERLVRAGWRVIVLWECGLRGGGAESELNWLPEAIRGGAAEVAVWPPERAPDGNMLHVIPKSSGRGLRKLPNLSNSK